MISLNHLALNIIMKIIPIFLSDDNFWSLLLFRVISSFCSLCHILSKADE